MIRSMPVLQVADVRRSRAFYCDLCGFQAHGAWGGSEETGPDFCIVQRGTVTLALDRARESAPAPVNQYWAVYVYVDDADALAGELSAKGVEIVRGPDDAPYGLRDFDIRDPDGHLVAFGHDIAPSSAAPGPGLAPL